MKNIAIVIGVSKYQRQTILLGSKNDAENIYQILQLSKKFEDILYLNNDKNSQETNNLLVEFIESHKGTEIEECLFYFSGHGEYLGDEFFYLLQDFDQYKRNQTSIQNSYIDSLLRSLNPKMAVKIIDACQSATQYIKDSSTLNTYFNEANNKFNKCYFMSSSHSDQSSYQNKHISNFTNSFIKALKTYPSSEIRYKNIIDFISDDFTGNSEQKPFFIIQADNTEKFCSIDDELRAYLDSYSGDSGLTTKSILDSTPNSFAELVLKNVVLNCNEQEATEIINNFKKTITDFSFEEDIKPLYSFKFDFNSSYDNLKELDVIVRFLESNKDERNYYVKIEYSTEIVEEPIYSHINYSPEYGPQTIQTGVKPKEVVKAIGFDLAFDAPFKRIDIDIVPKVDGLPSYSSTILFVVSRRFVRFFYYTTHYKEDGWNSKSLSNKINWKTEEFEIKDSVKIMEFFKELETSLNKYIIKSLQEKFNIQKEEEKEKDDDK